MLWASFIIGAVLVAMIALAALDRQRRLFFASNGKQPDGGPKRAGESDARRVRLRHAFLKIRKTVVRITAYPGGVPNFTARRRREHAAAIILRALSKTTAAPPNLPPTNSPEITDPPSTASAAAEGIVRVDRGGLLKFADPIARDLLHWSSGDLTLSAILGEREGAALIAAVARQEVVEQTVTLRTGASLEHLHATALASRGSDGCLLGALLFLRRL